MDMETSFVRDFARDLKTFFCNDFNDVSLNEIGCNIPVETIVPKIFKWFQKSLKTKAFRDFSEQGGKMFTQYLLFISKYRI